MLQIMHAPDQDRAVLHTHTQLADAAAVTLIMYLFLRCSVLLTAPRTTDAYYTVQQSRAGATLWRAGGH